MLEQSVPEGLHPTEGTHSGVACEELQPVGKTYDGEIHGGPSLVERHLTPKQGRSVWSPPSQEGVTETCYELTTTPICCPLAWMVRRRQRI